MNRSRLLVFGFDAGHPPWLEAWAKAGDLPALARVMERGWWAETVGAELISEHGVWTPLLSGTSRGRLGYYYFRQLRPGTYDLVPVTGCDMTAPYIWSRLTGGRRAFVIDVPEVLPIRHAPAVQIANWAPHFGWKSRHPAHQPVSEPPGLLHELKRRFGPRDDIIEQVGSDAATDRATLRRMLRRIERKGDMVRELVKRDRYDLLVVVFTEPHTAGHQFWKYRHVAPDGELRSATQNVYQAVDRELGRLLETVGDDVNVVVLSSVGLEDYYPTGGLMESFCRELGYQVPVRSTPWSWHPLSMARRVIPESWRKRASRALPRDTRERLLADQFRQGTDWSRTTAFALPGFYNGMIRVNLRGREPQGIVEPGREYDELLQRLETDLRKLIEPVSGQPAVQAVHRPGELFGEVPPCVFPDLWVRWRPSDRFWERLVHPRAELRQEKPEFFRESDHWLTGWIAMAGPSVRGRGAQPAVDVLAVAPTLLRLLGEEISAELSAPLTLV